MQDSQPKKGKKARRKRNESDEDIEKVLAELELEYSGQKKTDPASNNGESEPKNEMKIEKNDEIADEEDGKKKKKKGKKKNDAVETEEAKESVEDLEKNYEFADEEDGKKKKKKGKKKNDAVEIEEAKESVEDLEKNDEFADEEDGKKKKKKGKKKNDVVETEEVKESVEDLEKNDEFADEEDGKKKKKKGKKKNDFVETEEAKESVEDSDSIEPRERKTSNHTESIKGMKDDDMNDLEFEGGTVKTAAQKKKEKKEREKQKKMAQKKMEVSKKAESGEPSKDIEKEKSVEKEEKIAEDKDVESEPMEIEEGKKKKKKGGKEEPAKEKGKGPGRKTIAAMQEALKKVKEEEERFKREEEERIRQEELREKARLEQLQLEQERKEKKKLKEKQRRERLKAEGKLLTTKQKQDRARAQAMLEALRAQGIDLPDAGEKKPRPGTRIKPSKVKQQTSVDEKEEKKQDDESDKPDQIEVEIIDQQPKVEEERKEEVKDSWDAESSGGEHEDEDKSEETKDEDDGKKGDGTKNETSESEADTDSGSDGSESEDQESDNESELDDKMTDAERKRERARIRIQNRRIEAEKKKSLDNLRAAVVCVLGHVDTGKTKILDKLRKTHVQDGEAGGITQQIGATNVPIDAIQESTRHVKGIADVKFKIPGLLIIDTPGHESFSNLRNRGSSLCDIAILVVDIMHGLEPQTIESLNLLKQKKCPFVVALNKIDRLYDWQTMNRKDVHDIIKSQAINTQREFEKRAKDVIVQFAEQGLNAALYYENPDPKTYVSLVPTSAITGEGMGNLLALIVEACQGRLAKRLMFSEELQATVLEVKALPGLGTTIDCILVNGILREGDTMLVAGTDGVIVTQIRSLLMPQPLKELRVKNAYLEHREVKAAQGVKIAAKDLEKAIAGLNLQVAQKPDEVEVLKEEVAKELSSALGNIKLAERGVFVQASTLGALEALLDFLRSSKIPYAGIRIGPVVKKDVMKASIMLEHDSQYATILAFDVKIERDAQELADSLGVKIFQADIIYHLFDKFTAYREELQQRKRDENKHIAVFPCKLRVLPQYIFNSRDPIVMGVMVEAGILKEGTPLCVPSKEFVNLGIATSIEYNHKTVESARKGQEVCVKIEPIPGEAPKMYGRHFDEKDFIVSKISRQSIDAVKDYFREDLVKTDWQLMVELKKLFEIL